MAWYPQAKREDILVDKGFGSNGPMHSYTGVVLHCNGAESYDLYSYFKSHRSDGPTAHFQVAKDGTIWQYVDTAVSAWCQGAGNDDYISIESEGQANELATKQQIASIANILAWLHLTHSIPLTLANTPGQKGFGYHGMGAPSWGHAICPGIRRDQRTTMLTAAAAIIANTGEYEMNIDDFEAWSAVFFSPTARPDVNHSAEGFGRMVAAVGKALENPDTIDALATAIAAKMGK